MNDNIGNILNCDTCTISNVHICSSPINGFKAIHDELLLQLYNHVPLEDNPEWPILDSSMAQSARLWVNRVVISGVSDNIEFTITTTNGISTKTNATVC